MQEDREIRKRLASSYLPGGGDGLTLMTYCVRWNPQGSRFLFYFGNHCVIKERGEPRIAYVFTAKRDLTDIRLALDISRERRGVHWSWHPDGEQLIGYGPDPDTPGKICLALVRYDGSDYRKISNHASGGHPSICPTNHHFLVTDESTIPGYLVFIDLERGKEIRRFPIPRTSSDPEEKGRNPQRVCLHPVFSRDGTEIMVNSLSSHSPHKGMAIPYAMALNKLL